MACRIKFKCNQKNESNSVYLFRFYFSFNLFLILNKTFSFFSSRAAVQQLLGDDFASGPIDTSSLNLGVKKYQSKEERDEAFRVYIFIVSFSLSSLALTNFYCLFFLSFNKINYRLLKMVLQNRNMAQPIVSKAVALVVY